MCLLECVCVCGCVTRTDGEGRGLTGVLKCMCVLSVVMYVVLSVCGGMMEQKQPSIILTVPPGPPFDEAG